MNSRVLRFSFEGRSSVLALRFWKARTWQAQESQSGAQGLGFARHGFGLLRFVVKEGVNL